MCIGQVWLAKSSIAYTQLKSFCIFFVVEYFKICFLSFHLSSDVALSSDFIAGFCGETDEDHQDTLSLIRHVKYNFAFCFPYSMRQVLHLNHFVSWGREFANA